MSAVTVNRAIVKHVISGDCVVVRGKPQGGPPPERTIALSNLIAPRMARKADTQDEPFSWESREFLRTRLVGKEVVFTVDGKNPQGKEYGTIYLPTNANSARRLPTAQELLEGGEYENINEAIVSAGLVDVRRLNSGSAVASAGEGYRRVLALEDTAKSTKRGKWCEEGSQAPLAIRSIEWTIPNPVQFVEANKQRPLTAIVEHVRDGCTYRLLLLPEPGAQNPVFHTFMLILSGLRTPVFKQEGDSQVPEEFAEEARFFVESRLLQRQVTVQLETISGQSLVGSVLHPKGNIAHLLLEEGYARCVDWSMAVVSSPGGAEAMRKAERLAKEKRLRLWRNWQGSTASAADIVASIGNGANGYFTNAVRTQAGDPAIPDGGAAAAPIIVPNPVLHGKVIEVGNGDCLVVKCAHDDVQRRFYLASVRPPRTTNLAQTMPSPNNPRPRPLYDIPYMFEAREFLRKKLVGKKVSVHVDYTQAPLQEGQEPRICATVYLGTEINVGEALVAKGLATVVKYRPGEEKRSRAYDQLLAAEAVAQKKAVGVHSKKEPPTHRVAELTGDVNKSRQFLPFLKRSGRLEGIVEFVASGSRFRIYIPKETCIITFLCAGIDCPKPSRRLPNGKEEPADPKGQEALNFTRELVLQREVELEVDTMDKAGNFVGWMFLSNTGSTTPAGGNVGNLSVALVESGLAKVHFTAERSAYFTALTQAEEKASSARLGVWSLEKKVDSLDEPGAKKGIVPMSKSKLPAQKCKAVVSCIKNEDLRFTVLLTEETSTLKQLSKKIALHIEENPPVPGSYSARQNDLCLALFSEDLHWYRAKVLKILAGGKEAKVYFVDYGNEEVVRPLSNRLIAIPPGLGLSAVPAQAKEFRLAGVQLPPEGEDKKTVWESMQGDLMNKEVEVNPEYEDAVSVRLALSADAEAVMDYAEMLLREGVVCVENHRDLRADLRSAYLTAEQEARRAHRNIWRYGDFRGDE